MVVRIKGSRVTPAVPPWEHPPGHETALMALARLSKDPSKTQKLILIHRVTRVEYRVLAYDPEKGFVKLQSAFKPGAAMTVKFGGREDQIYDARWG